MALELAAAQRLSEMRSRMLQNIKQGKKPEEGFTSEELSEGLAMIRQNKSAAASSAAAKAKKPKKEKAAKVPLDTKAFFGDLDLDEDDEEDEAASK